MDHLAHLAIIWGGVYVAVVAAERTKLTPVLYYLAIGCLLVNVGILPTEAFYTLMIAAFCLNVAVPVSIRMWKPYMTGEKIFRLA